MNELAFKLPMSFIDGVMRRVFEDKLSHAPYNLTDFRRSVDLDRDGGLSMWYSSPQTDLAWRMYLHGANAMFDAPEHVIKRIKEMP